MYVKPGHEEALRRVGVRPPAKVPHKVQEELEPKFDELYETCEPIDGRELFVASQVVPVTRVKNGKHHYRLCINYKNTINDHLMAEPHVGIFQNPVSLWSILYIRFGVYNHYLA
ncbi:unnamed protein product [Meganyctiphanes norvegica]|uniref:Uncharacterized protein n=1 Tax=Meganyctiphanes norvegica TaxID=48144 RepID=A0AAV2SUF2_MEGNR